VVRIRLRRMGAKKSPYYRIVITDKRSPRDGRFIEAIGTYDPHTKPETVNLDRDRACYWLNQGAQPSDGTVRLLKRAKLIDDAGKPTPCDQSAAAVVATVPVAAEKSAQPPVTRGPAIVALDDDLALIEGIGPKIAELLNDAGITSFAQLAATDAARIQEILDAAGPAYNIVDSGAWPEQARLAAAGNMDGLKALQERLTAKRN